MDHRHTNQTPRRLIVLPGWSTRGTGPPAEICQPVRFSRRGNEVEHYARREAPSNRTGDTPGSPRLPSDLHEHPRAETARPAGRRRGAGAGVAATGPGNALSRRRARRPRGSACRGAAPPSARAAAARRASTASASVTRTLFTETPPSAIARRAAERPATRPDSARRSTTGC